jgi:AraC-like DNA-binding protein
MANANRGAENCEEENLALKPGVQIRVSVPNSISCCARDPRVLLNEVAHRLDGHPLSDFAQSRTRDTYDGQNRATGPDWYAIEFPEPVTFDCIEMTTGFPYRDGGWWTSLAVEMRADDGDRWRQVEGLNVTPPYNTQDTRAGRRPYETYALTFTQVTAQAVRVIGRPGGLAQFTSLARLAVYNRDLSRWNPARLPEPPVPYFFRLIFPRTIWDLSDSLVRLTGLRIRFPFMEFYLDSDRQQKLWQTIRRNYEGEPELWFLVGETMGWDIWERREDIDCDGRPTDAQEPHVRITFHNTIATAVTPVRVENQVLGEMTTHPVVLAGQIDWDWHQRFAQEHGISWTEYRAAIERSPHMTRDQLEGAAALLGMIANVIASLAHRNLHLEYELSATRGARGAADERLLTRKDIVRQAIDFMERNLENPIGVAQIAQAVALSPSYFSTLFTQQTGHNPSEFLIDLRLERAKEYLAHTQMSVMDVCVALGYSPSYFSRVFKQRVGFTPGQYAQRLRGASPSKGQRVLDQDTSLPKMPDSLE